VTPTLKRRPVRGTWDERRVEVPRAEWEVSRAYRTREEGVVCDPDAEASARAWDMG